MINRSTYLSSCPKLFTNLAIDSQLPISETQCLDSSITSQGSTNQFSSFLQYAGIMNNNRCEFFRLQLSSIGNMNIIYHGNSIPDWFTNRSTENYVKVELPSDWCRGFGTCVIFKRKKLCEFIAHSVKNFDGSSLGNGYSYDLKEYFEGKPIRNNESYMTWLHYEKNTQDWKEAKNFVTFCLYENDEIEVKEYGARLICDEERFRARSRLEYVTRPPNSITTWWGHKLVWASWIYPLVVEKLFILPQFVPTYLPTHRMLTCGTTDGLDTERE
ncbi:hypothetical protein Tco_0569177 [Tanacetum coccineum]